MGTPEIIVISVIGLIINIAILYYVIRGAVKSANKEIIKYFIHQAKRDGLSTEEIYKLYHDDVYKMI